MYNQDLMHYGVKGMKWGRRKARTSKKSQPLSYKKRARAMSNEELQTKITRLNLERSYVNLAREMEPKTAKQAVYDTLTGGLTTSGRRYEAGVQQQLANTALQTTVSSLSKRKR